jgi:hypothetical protein
VSEYFEHGAQLPSAGKDGRRCWLMA